MRSIALLLVAGCLHTARSAPDIYEPYSDPLFELSDNAILVKRQSGCQLGYNSCESLGAADICCPTDTNCALDQAGNVACCQIGAVCTGQIGGGSPTETTALGSGTTTTGFVLGGSTTTPTVPPTTALPTVGVVGGGSTVPNGFYPFIFIPTSYENQVLCTSYYSYCQSQSTACFNSLAGQVGVTVSGFGEGITVQGQTGTALSSASSICSSLSQQGCYGLQETQCANFGGSPNTATGTFVQIGNNGPRQTPCPGLMYAAGAGVMFGAVGGMMG